MATKTDIRIVKVAWIRDRRIRPGISAPGQLNCACGSGPVILYEIQPNIICQCGVEYTWDGWIVNNRRQS